jgi:hypothetical protein
MKERNDYVLQIAGWAEGTVDLAAGLRQVPAAGRHETPVECRGCEVRRGRRGILLQHPQRKDAVRELFIMGEPTRDGWIQAIRNFVLTGARHAWESIPEDMKGQGKF